MMNQLWPGNYIAEVHSTNPGLFSLSSETVTNYHVYDCRTGWNVFIWTSLVYQGWTTTDSASTPQRFT